MSTKHIIFSQIIVGSIVTRSPSSSMAPSAFIELGLACDLFEKGATQSLRIRSGLVRVWILSDASLFMSFQWQAILCKMREKAFHIYSQFRTGNPNASKVLSIDKPDYGDDELALFGGQTRVLVTKLLNCSGKTRHPASNSTSVSNTPSSDSGDSRATGPVSDLSHEVHPSLVEYLSMFPPSNAPSRNSPEGGFNASSDTPDVTQSQLNLDQQNGWQNWVPQTLFTPLPSATYNSISAELSPFAPSGSGPYPSININNGRTEASIGIKLDPSDSSLVDLGMMMTGESGMDEQWMSFMRDSGILHMNSSGNGVPLYTSSPPYDTSQPHGP